MSKYWVQSLRQQVEGESFKLSFDFHTLMMAHIHTYKINITANVPERKMGCSISGFISKHSDYYKVMKILYNVFLGGSACQLELQPIFNYILYMEYEIRS